MTATQIQGEKALKFAESKFRDWAAHNGVSVQLVLPLAYFEERNPSTLIYIFFPTDSDLQGHRVTHKLQEIESCYRKFLAEALFPMDRFPVSFRFDSHQHVQESYDGNIYNYLR
jgi:hypothetical protein